MDERSADVDAGMAWLLSLIGPDANARWRALGPLALAALEKKDVPAFEALIAAGASPWIPMEAALSTDDISQWPLLLSSAVKTEGGINLRSLRKALLNCAERSAEQCFRATAKMLEEANVVISSNSPIEGPSPIYDRSFVFDQQRLWEAVSKTKTPAAASMARAAVAAGYLLDASWPHPSDPSGKRTQCPLDVAISADNLDLAREMFSLGACAKRSSLVRAIWRPETDMLSLVLAHAGNDPENDGMDCSPLEAAICSAAGASMRVLLAAGANPDGLTEDDEPLTMLQLVMKQPTKLSPGNALPEEMCAILLSAGADPSLAIHGEAPLDTARKAASYGHKAEILKLFEDAIALRALVAELESSALAGLSPSAPSLRL